MTRVGVIGMINSGLSIPGPPTTPHYRENYVSLARLLYRQSNAMHSVRSSFVLDISLYQIRFFSSINRLHTVRLYISLPSNNMSYFTASLLISFLDFLHKLTWISNICDD